MFALLALLASPFTVFAFRKQLSNLSIYNKGFRVMMTRTIALIAITAAVMATVKSNAFAADRLVFGVVPQQSASRLARVWVPVLNALAERVGQPVAFATAKDIPTFEACLAAGTYDVAYMNPYHYVVFHDVVGYDVIAHQADRRLKGLMVTRKDGGVSRLEDLQDATIAFPSPAAFGSSVIPRAELAEQKVRFTPQYVNSHDSVYRGVALGLFPAGGGVLRTFNMIPQELRDQLTVFYETSEYTPHAIAVLPSVPRQQRDKLLKALMSLDEETPELLAGIGITAFSAARDADYDDIRGLNLSREHSAIIAEANDQCRSG